MGLCFWKIKARDVNRANKEWNCLREAIKTLEGYREQFCPVLETIKSYELSPSGLKINAIDNEIERLDKCLDKLRV